LAVENSTFVAVHKINVCDLLYVYIERTGATFLNAIETVNP